MVNVSKEHSSNGPWLGLYTLVIVVFFAEHLFLNRSILPLDVLNELLLPRVAGTRIQVQTHYPIDEVTQLAPNARFWRDEIRAGELPIWNPDILGGNPHQASTIWGVFTPFKLPYLLPIPIERAYTWGLVFQFWIAGLLIFAYLREIGRVHRPPFLAPVRGLSAPISSCFIGSI